MIKCHICKKELTIENAYLLIKGDRKIYYCNKEEYDSQQSELVDWSDLYEYIRLGIFSYDKTMALSTYLVKRLKELRLNYSYKIILETFKIQTKTILYWINTKRELDTEYKKINYMMAIIKNNINDVYLKSKRQNMPNIVNINIDDRNIRNDKIQPVNKGISDYLGEDI
jgi:hypothetical protein